MQKYGIDCVALQRFGSELSNPTLKAQRDGMATRVKNASQDLWPQVLYYDSRKSHTYFIILSDVI